MFVCDINEFVALLCTFLMIQKLHTVACICCEQLKHFTGLCLESVQVC